MREGLQLSATMSVSSETQLVSNTSKCAQMPKYRLFHIYIFAIYTFPIV